MSEIKLNLLDSHSLLTATVHGSVGDALVAALSTEPETIEELETALKRFRKCDSLPASTLRRQQRGPIDEELWDAGILVIDLAARIVTCKSTYSLPTRSGKVDYHNGCQSTRFPLGYLLSDDWYFAPTIGNYQHHCDRRIKERQATPALDTRAILYGKPLLEFIVDNLQLLDTTTNRKRKHHREAVVDIHRRWLMTPREDLSDQSVREILFAKRELIDFDLESRILQWSFFLEEPPSLSNETNAYRLAGYGTHEWVMYYDLVRFLIWEAIDLKIDLASHANHLLSSHCCRPKSVIAPLAEPSSMLLDSNPVDNSPVTVRSIDGCENASSSETVKLNDTEHEDWRYRSSKSARAFFNLSDQEIGSVRELQSDQRARRSANGEPTRTELIDYLAAQQAQWLSTPKQEIDNYIPAEVIDNERRRRPEAMTGRSMVVDEDCYCCKMMGDESEAGLGIYFCHFDGCNMEDEFAFSACATLEEWQEEQRKFEQWSRKSEHERNRKRDEASSAFMNLDDCEIPF